MAPHPDPLPQAGEGIGSLARSGLLEMALRPAAGLAAWQVREPGRWAPALAGLQQLVAADAQQEAVAIALTLREALETPGARAALVTPDRDLARRVSAELIRHGIVADDSAGEPLGDTPPGAFLRLLAELMAADFAPVPLLAVLKHPLCAGGWDRARWLRAVRRLERAALRGSRPAAGLAGLRAAAAAGLGAPGREAALAEAMALLDRLDGLLGPFAAVMGAGVAAPAALLEQQLAAAVGLAADEALPGGLRLFAGEVGEPLAEHLSQLAEALLALPPIEPGAWPALFGTALAGATAPSLRASRGREGGAHPRVEILGLLEARLLRFDRVVLGALEETIWPQATDPGPWMSRPMRTAFGLPEPEARIGRVAADFLFVACAAPEAVLSRAAKRGGAPSVPARWLTRLETFLKGQGLAVAASPAAGWAGLLDQPDRVVPWARPAPAPPAAVRPRGLSLSDVGQLIADPYAFYARRVLRLAPLDPLEQDAGAADYGNLVHRSLHLFLRELGPGWPGEAAAQAVWDRASAAALAEAAARPAVAAFWGPRLANIGGFVLREEAALRQAGGLVASHAEVRAKLVLERPGGTVTLEARADRLDQLKGGGWRILDYKTGTVPREDELFGGEAPQLPLEAMLLAGGAFEKLPAGPASALIYWKLTGGEQAGEIETRAPDSGACEALAALARDGLVHLVDGFLLGDRAFLSRPHPDRSGFGITIISQRVDEWGQAG